MTVATADWLRTAAAEILCRDEAQITDDAQLVRDLDADSLDRVEFSMLIEERTGVDIDTADLAPIVTFGDLVSFVDRIRAAA